jgi:hypothetical protein
MKVLRFAIWHTLFGRSCQSFCDYPYHQTLMMGTEIGPETSATFKELKRLIVRENIFNFNRWKFNILHWMLNA